MRQSPGLPCRFPYLCFSSSSHAVTLLICARFPALQQFCRLSFEPFHAVLSSCQSKCAGHFSPLLLILKDMKKLQFLLPIVLVMGCWSSQAIAQPSSTPQSQANEEEALDNAIEQFGYTSGAAFQCVPSSETAGIEQNALRVFTGIARLFGSDRAFFYAAAYGAGATAPIDRGRCTQHVRQFRDSLQNSPLTGGGQP